MQQPTIGRTVHFTAPSEEGGETYAAIITRVHNESVVSLVTFGPSSLYFHDAVPISTSNGEGPDPGCWNWPPRV